jgi:hypothetical protein
LGAPCPLLVPSFEVSATVGLQYFKSKILYMV